MTVKKYFKIFLIEKEFTGTFSTPYIFRSVFHPIGETETKDQCEQIIEHMGLTGDQYAIVEVWEKEKE